MERLTHKIDGENILYCGNEDAGQGICNKEECAASDPCEVEQAAIDRLAAQEDTDLTPDEIKQMRREWLDTERNLREGVTRLTQELEAALEDMKVGWTCRACKKRVPGREWCTCPSGNFVNGPERVSMCSSFEWRGVSINE